VRLYGALRCAQLTGNLLIELAANHERKNLAFAGREPGHAGTQRIELVILRTLLRVARKRTFDCGDQLLAGDRLGEKILRACLDCPHAGRNVPMAGHEHDRKAISDLR
jgi:hypothetical protein